LRTLELKQPSRRERQRALPSSALSFAPADSSRSNALLRNNCSSGSERRLYVPADNIKSPSAASFNVTRCSVLL
jgi:hypothetical protein